MVLKRAGHSACSSPDGSSFRDIFQISADLDIAGQQRRNSSIWQQEGALLFAARDVFPFSKRFYLQYSPEERRNTLLQILRGTLPPPDAVGQSIAADTVALKQVCRAFSSYSAFQAALTRSPLFRMSTFTCLNRKLGLCNPTTFEQGARFTLSASKAGSKSTGPCCRPAMRQE
jgi:hypothetical protein